MSPSLKLAQRLALGIPAVLLAGAYVSEYGFGLYPCDMCWWQRYAHFAAVALALVSIDPPKVLTSIFVLYALSGYAVYFWRLAKGKPVSIVQTEEDALDPSERR